MKFWNRLFGKNQTNKRMHQVVPPTKIAPEKISVEDEGWEEIPFFIPSEAVEKELISLIATSIAAENHTESSFVIKKIMEKNPEVKHIAIIVASIASGVAPASQFVIRKIYQKK